MQSVRAQQHMQLQSQSLWPAQRVICRNARLPHCQSRVQCSNIDLASMSETCKDGQQCTCGIVIVDHGSRRKASNDMLLEFCALYQQITNHSIVEPAHMEIAEPTIAQAIGELTAAVVTACCQAPPGTAATMQHLSVGLCPVQQRWLSPTVTATDTVKQTAPASCLHQYGLHVHAAMHPYSPSTMPTEPHLLYLSTCYLDVSCR